ncbi:hypothetical protein [Bacillus andreraoultii]|uniref:hypothetical protein n=1 Tax=Bacillus andreraoultii TaxID=1499685 RepID=UPI00053A15A4|nr:hypothetical protein [Bacillus andreraoultii]
MEGIIFGFMALGFLLLYGSLHYVFTIRRTKSNYYQNNLRKQLIVITAGSVFSFSLGIIIFIYFK